MVASKKFTLKYLDGREEHYENYRYYERLSGNEKITRNGKKLYKGGKIFYMRDLDYWVEVIDNKDNVTEFTLEFKDGTTKDFINYGYHAHLQDENKITRSKGRLYYRGKVFEQVIKDYWVEIEKGSKRKSVTTGVKYEKPTIEYKNGRKRSLSDFYDYVEDGVIKIKDNGRRMYYDGRIFVKIGKNHWLEDRVKIKGKTCKFRLEFLNGEVKQFENYAKCKKEGIIKISTGNKVMFYEGYRFTRDSQDRHRWLQDPHHFNRLVDKFYFIKDENVWEFENMQTYFDREDNEHMQLNEELISATNNKKPGIITRSIIYKRTKYYNVDNYRTWIAESIEKPKKEILNHSNKIPITKFYKEGVWYFTPDKKTTNYRHFLKSNEIYVFSNKYAFWSDALWEKQGNVWHYRKEMLKADKVKNFIIPIKEDEYYFKAEIKHLRKMGYKINYRYVNSKRQQPNKRNSEQQEDFMNKVKKMSRADRKKALNKKKKREGKYFERRGL